MKKLFGFLIVVVLFCSSLVSKAQNDGLGVTFMPLMPYANYYNPGIAVPYDGMFGLMVSNINFSVYNSSIKRA